MGGEASASPLVGPEFENPILKMIHTIRSRN